MAARAESMRLVADRRDNVVAVTDLRLDAAGVRPDRISAPRLRRRTLAAAAVAHALVLLIAQFGVPFLFFEPPVAADVIPVAVVTIDQITTPPPPAKAAETPEPPPPPPPEVASAPPEPPPPPPPPVPETPVVPEPEPKPELAPPEVAPKPPEPQVSQALARATPLRRPKPPARRDFTQVLKDLDLEEEPARTAETPPPEEPAPTQPQQVADATATEIDALRALIRRQIEPCWSPPVGAEYAEDLVVGIRVWVDPDGTVRRADIVNGGLMALDSFYEAAADSARRAVLNPQCNPLELPRDHYKIWQQMELTFNPQEMLGL